MNDTHNISFPKFIEDYNEDFTAFKALLDTEVDYLFQQTWDLYSIKDFDKMPILLVRLALDYAGISHELLTDNAKRAFLRGLSGFYANKGLAVVYEEIIKLITGETPLFSIGSTAYARIRNESIRNEGVRSVLGNQFYIYIDPIKSLLYIDAIVELLTKKIFKPAFLKLMIKSHIDFLPGGARDFVTGWTNSGVSSLVVTNISGDEYSIVGDGELYDWYYYIIEDPGITGTVYQISIKIENLGVDTIRVNLGVLTTSSAPILYVDVLPGTTVDIEESDTGAGGKAIILAFICTATSEMNIKVSGFYASKSTEYITI